MVRSLFLALATAGIAAAHFELLNPATMGFDEDKEGTAPCGGEVYTDFSNATELTMDKFSVLILSTHPEGDWTFSITTDLSPPYHFSQITPQVKTTGAGTFCLDHMSVPENLEKQIVYKQGLLQVVDNSVDGMLYQCAPVKFVSGSSTTAIPDCKNVTGFTAEWATNAPRSEENSTKSDAPSAPKNGTQSSAGVAAMAPGMGSLLGLGLLAAGLAI